MVDEAVRAQLTRYQAQWQWPASVRLTPSANFHLTLHFLGEVTRPDEARLRVALSTVAMQPLHLRLTTPGHFDQGIAFIEPTEHPGLRALQAALGNAVAAAGLPATANWHPHVTLARKAIGAQPPSAPLNIDWRAGSYALVWSHGGRYEVIAICDGFAQGAGLTTLGSPAPR